MDWGECRSIMFDFARAYSDGDDDLAEDAAQEAIVYLLERNKSPEEITPSYMKQLVLARLRNEEPKRRERAEARFVDLHYAGQGEHPGEVRGSFQIKGPGE